MMFDKNYDFEIIGDNEGINFVGEKKFLQLCNGLSKKVSSHILHQFITLQGLVEQGLAEMNPGGFLIYSEDAVRLDDDVRKILGLPDPWPGEFEAQFSGNTFQPNFSLSLVLIKPNGDKIINIDFDGPIFYVTREQLFLPSESQWLAINAVRNHEKLTANERNEYNNLFAVHSLKYAKEHGCDIQLKHFESLETIEPSDVAVTGYVEDNGDLKLIPYFEGIENVEEVEERLWQLDSEGKVESLRIGDKIVLLDKIKKQALKEILTNRTIPKDQVPQFIKTPNAFLDASLVNLELGFSLRVKGVAKFIHAYFGETDASSISWFEKALSDAENISPPGKLVDLIDAEDKYEEIKKKVEDAYKSGATIITVDEESIDISDRKSVKKALLNALEKLSDPGGADPEPGGKGFGEKPDIVVVDAALNDTKNEFGGEDYPSKIEDILFRDDISWDYLKRKPFKHQEEGIRWLLGLLKRNLQVTPEESDNGAILADDMGLGKTYMSLVGISEYYNLCKNNDIPLRPVLVVAPLSLMENWRDEVECTFDKAPFKDIVILQQAADLRKYRIKGMGGETRQNLSNSEDNSSAEIRYSLKIGSEHGLDRLDLPQRLVITTYDALRDYQFSLCQIDWSFVVFDEAQNIKNPNTLATRAAKGLKSCFKLIVTGTPVENHLGDFWCLMDTARPGALGAYQEFRKQFVLPIKKAANDEVDNVRMEVGKELRNTVGALMLRRMKEDHLDNLPNKKIIVGIKEIPDGWVYEDSLSKVMKGEQLKKYNDIIDAVNMDRDSDKKNPILAGLQYLKQTTLHPFLNASIDGLEIPDSRNKAITMLDQSGKLNILRKTLDEIKGRDEKAIIFLIDKRLQSFLRVALQRLYNINIDIINGDTKAIAKTKKNSGLTRKALIAKFESSPGFGIIIMSPVAAGTGLTIVGANNVIHLERHWNPAKESQATDRVYRIGQKRDVNVYIPILEHPDFDSFDLNLHRLLSRKLELKDAIVTPTEVHPDDLATSFGKREQQKDSDIISNVKDIMKLGWDEYEAFCAELFKREFNSETGLTKGSGDCGADIVVKGDINALVECKHTKNKKWTSNEPLMKVDFARKKYSELFSMEFKRFILITTAKKYSGSVINNANMLGVELYGLPEIKKLIKKHVITKKDIQSKLLQNKIEVS